MNKHKKHKEIMSPVSRVLRYFFSIVLLLYTSTTIFVLGNTLMNSFKTKSELIKHTFGWPEIVSFANYCKVLLDGGFGRYFFNSLILVGCGCLLLMLLASMVAYGIARYQFRMKGFMQTYFLFGMMFPIQLSILPLFIILRKLALLNTLPGMVLLYAAGMSFPVFVFSKFFATIPTALEESGRLDGASEWTIFFRLILPICKPVLATIALINSVTIWNDFYMPMVFLGKEEVRTLTLGIYKYMENFLKSWDVAFAAVVITLVPIIILYFLFSNQIVAGLTSGAVKE